MPVLVGTVTPPLVFTAVAAIDRAKAYCTVTAVIDVILLNDHISAHAVVCIDLDSSFADVFERVVFDSSTLKPLDVQAIIGCPGKGASGHLHIPIRRGQ